MNQMQIKKYGILIGLFQGSLPGLGSVFFRNGTSMIVMLNVQKFLTQLGFRN